MKTGAELISAERRRQIEIEGYAAAHDAEQDEDSDQSGLVPAAIAYAAAPDIVYRRHTDRETAQGVPGVVVFEDYWPSWWDDEHDKRHKHSQLRRLVIAGALLAAEIDRIQRGVS